METKKNLLIRADASVSMGTGHIMRMIALAQAWQDGGGEAVFLCAEITPSLERRLKEEGFLLEKIQVSPGIREDLEATCAAIAHYGAALIPVALDGYQFDADFQLGLKNAGCRLLVMDDYGHAAFYHADWVLNQNISAREELYTNRASYTQLLLGTKFALLRREFLKYCGWQRQIPDIARKVLVTLGGADPDNVTGKVIEALVPLDVEVKVVVGGSNPHLPELQQAVESITAQPAKIELVVNPTDMPGLMFWADLAIAAGGSTAWELAYMGVPSVFMILAQNQADVAKRLQAKGIGVCFGEARNFDKQPFTDLVASIAHNSILRKTLSTRGTTAIAGQGSSLVTNLLSHYPLQNRFADMQDCMLLWEWVNDPAVRNSAFQDRPILLEDHQKWCREKLTSDNCIVTIISDCYNTPVGQVRFEYNGEEAVADISLAKPFRGRGFSDKVLQLGIQALPRDNRWRRVKAYIKTNNIKSQKTFKRLGFSSGGEITICGHPARVHILNRE